MLYMLMFSRCFNVVFTLCEAFCAWGDVSINCQEKQNKNEPITRSRRVENSINDLVLYDQKT